MLETFHYLLYSLIQTEIPESGNVRPSLNELNQEMPGRMLNMTFILLIVKLWLVNFFDTIIFSNFLLLYSG